MAKYRVKHTLKRLLKQHSITQVTLAEELEIDESTISRKMNGDNDWTLKEIVAVARLLSMKTPDVFLVEYASDEHRSKVNG